MLYRSNHTIILRFQIRMSEVCKLLGKNPVSTQFPSHLLLKLETAQ